MSHYSRVWCVTWLSHVCMTHYLHLGWLLIHSCDMTHHPQLWHDSSSTTVTWLLIHNCDMTHHLHLWHDSLFASGDMTHYSHMGHDPLFTSMITHHSHVWHGSSFTRVPWLIIHRLRHDSSFACVTWLIIQTCATWLSSHICDMTHNSHMWHDSSFTYMITHHSHVWHDPSFTRVPWLITTSVICHTDTPPRRTNRYMTYGVVTNNRYVTHIQLVWGGFG